MKRLVISGLLSLAAVSCGSSDKYKDLKSTFCGGASVVTGAKDTNDADKAKLTSCHGTYWKDVADKAACEAKIVDGLDVKLNATSTAVKLSTLTADELKTYNDYAKTQFKNTVATLVGICAVGGVTPATP
jgi:hypothetical protein